MTTLTLNFILFLSMAQSIAVKENIPPVLLQSICYVESGGNPNIINYHDGDGDSYGLCQIKLTTARMYGFGGDFRQLLKPFVNLTYAARHIRYLMNKYQNVDCAIAAYNYGTCKKNSRGQIWNRGYVKKVHNKIQKINS